MKDSNRSCDPHALNVLSPAAARQHIVTDATIEGRSALRTLAYSLAQHAWDTHSRDPGETLRQFGAEVVIVREQPSIGQIFLKVDPVRVEVRPGLSPGLTCHVLAHELGHLLAARARLFHNVTDPMIEEWFCGRVGDRWCQLAGWDVAELMREADFILSIDAALAAKRTTKPAPKPRTKRSRVEARA